MVDSRLAGGAQALLALSAARWAGEMADHREVARRVERSIERNHGFVLVDTLAKYLAMGATHRQARIVPGPPGRGAPIQTHRRHPRWWRRPSCSCGPAPHPQARAQARIVGDSARAGSRNVHQLHLSYSTMDGPTISCCPGPSGRSWPTSWPTLDGGAGAYGCTASCGSALVPSSRSRFGPVLGTHLGPNTIGVAATQGSVEDD